MVKTRSLAQPHKKEDPHLEGFILENLKDINFNDMSFILRFF